MIYYGDGEEYNYGEEYIPETNSRCPNCKAEASEITLSSGQTFYMCQSCGDKWQPITYAELKFDYVAIPVKNKELHS